MRYLGYVFIAVGLAVILYGIFGGRRRRPSVPGAASGGSGLITAAGPAVSDFHVAGTEARVTFDVELPDGGANDALKESLVSAAVEAVLEKKASLPIDGVTTVSAIVDGKTVGSAELNLPDEIDTEGLENVEGVEGGPMTGAEVEVPDAPEELVLPSTGGADELKKLSDDLSIPESIDAALRAAGLDPESADAPELVRGALTHQGYSVAELGGSGYVATKGGETLYVHNVSHSEDDHPELSDGDIRSFVAAAASSPAAKAILVTAKFAPFSVYAREKANPAIRFVSRERLQEFITQLTLS